MAETDLLRALVESFHRRQQQEPWAAAEPLHPALIIHPQTISETAEKQPGKKKKKKKYYLENQLEMQRYKLQ